MGRYRNGRGTQLTTGAAAIAALLTLVLAGSASSYTPNAEPTWVVSGSGGGVVTSVAVSGSTAYLGGAFDYVGPPTGSFVAVDPASSALASPWPAVGGNVYAVASDGAGGFFIGGQFSSIGTKHADNIAHIKADGTLDTAWAGSTNGTVYTIQVAAGRVYVGGAFTTAGGASHINLAAFDGATGAVVVNFTTNATGTNAFVTVLRVSGTNVFAGGSFTALGDQSRTNLGAFRLDGPVGDWAPNTNGVVYALAVANTGNVYVGGEFTKVNNNGTDRSYIAGFTANGQVLANWDPFPNAPVYALDIAPGGTMVYVGGAFEEIGDLPRNGLASVPTTGGGDPTPWDPDIHGQVFAITAPGNGAPVYVGGSFDSVNTTLARDNVAAIDPGTADATGFWSGVGGEVDALAVSSTETGTKLGIGGEFRTAGGGAGPPPTPLHRSNLAAIDLATGTATTWNPRTNGAVEVVKVNGGSVYAGGEFTTVNGGLARERLASFDMNLGAATSWNPGVHNGGVLALAFSGSTAYVGGSFGGAGAVSTPPVARNGLAAFSTDGFGDLRQPWDPNLNGDVFALDVVGSTLYVGGTFTTVRGGTTRNRLAALTTDTSVTQAAQLIRPWNPNANGAVYALAHAGSVEYAGGAFTQVNGSVARGAAAAFDGTSGVVTAWNPQPLFSATSPGSVTSLQPSGSTMYMSGLFRTVGGPWTGTDCNAPCFLSPTVAAVSLTTGAPNRSWAPASDDLVWSIALAPQGLVLGGQFDTVGFPPPGGLPTNGVNQDEPAASYRGGFGLVRALPDAPTISAAPGNGEATVTFGAPAYTGGVPLTSYTLTVSPGGQTIPSAASPTVVGDLTNGVTYTFTLVANSSVGTSEPAVATATPRTIPDAPTGVTAAPGNLQATVSFAPPAWNGGEGPSLYTVRASTGQTATGTTSPIVVTGLTNDEPVTFTVQAENSAGKGPESAPSDPVVPVEPGRPHRTPPSAPRPAVPDLPPGLPSRIPPPGH
jgi:hypothetical protein